MPNTFVKIASITVGAGGASNMNFSSIPQTYTDLQIVISPRSAVSSTQDYLSMQFNSSSVAQYSHLDLVGTGSSASSSVQTALDRYYFTWVTPGSNATTNTFGNIQCYIPNYAGSTNKSFSIDGVPENNTSSIQYTTLSAGLWTNTSAITSITLLNGNGNFVQYSTATLYGIKNS